MMVVKRIVGLMRDMWSKFTSTCLISVKRYIAWFRDKIKVLTIWFEIIVLITCVTVIVLQTFYGVDASSGWQKFSYDVCLNLMAASFLTLCIEVIGMKLSYLRTRADEANAIIRGAEILHSAVENYVSAHLDLSFGKMEDLQKWFFGNQDKRLRYDGVFMMREDFSPSELGRMFSQTIFLFHGLSSKPVYTYLNRETELRNGFEKLYMSMNFTHFPMVRDLMLEFITGVDNEDCKIAIEEAGRVKFGDTTEAQAIIKDIQSGYFSQYVRDIESGKKKMTANSMNPYAILYWKMKRLRNILVDYELAIDKIREEISSRSQDKKTHSSTTWRGKP